MRHLYAKWHAAAKTPGKQLMKLAKVFFSAGRILCSN